MSLRKSETLGRWTLLDTFCLHFWAWLLNTEITPKSEDKKCPKVFNVPDPSHLSICWFKGSQISRINCSSFFLEFHWRADRSFITFLALRFFSLSFFLLWRIHTWILGSSATWKFSVKHLKNVLLWFDNFSKLFSVKSLW